MRATLFPTAGLALGLVLAGCSDAGDPTVTRPTTEAAAFDHDGPYFAVEVRLPRRIGDLEVLVTEVGQQAAGMAVDGPDGESADLDLDVGESGTVFDHTFELLHVEGQSVRLAVTDPSGTELGD